jgi:hypothetical protein
MVLGEVEDRGGAGVEAAHAGELEAGELEDPDVGEVLEVRGRWLGRLGLLVALTLNPSPRGRGK